jgi:hypothetical protein
MSTRLLNTVLVLAASFLPLFAHHGTATSYDQKRTVTIKGTVTEFIWRNPHCALFLDVTGADGKVVNYSIEMFSPSLMVGRGYTRNLFKKGDLATLDVHPSLANLASGECLGCRITVNGKEPGRSK